MYILELHVDGFGALSGVRCAFDAPVTVVFGPNEAGKSTLHRFLIGMLYGFATRANPVERSEPVRGGRHGGRLALRGADGREWVLERYADGTGRRGAVLLEGSGAERAVPQAELERLLLGGVTERLFRQLFAVTLDSLHELRALQADEIGSYLYDAGMAGGARLSAAGRQLAAEMDKLYRPRGSVPEINRLLQTIRDKEAELRRSRDGVAAYNACAEALAETERELARLDALVPEQRTRVAAWQGAVEARPWWLRERELALEEAELAAGLGDPGSEPLPEEAGAVWTAARKAREEAERQARRAREELEALRAQRAALQWDERAAALLEKLEALDAQREAAAARREELLALAGELRSAEEEAARIRSALSPRWEEADLDAFGGAADREQVRRFRASLSEARRAMEPLAAELARLDRQLAAAAEDGGADRAAAAAGTAEAPVAFAPATRAALLQAWHRLEDALRDWDRLVAADSGPAAGAPSPSASPSRSRRRGAGRRRMRAALYAAAGCWAAALLNAALAWAGAGGLTLPGAAASALLLLAGAGWAGRRAEADASAPGEGAEPEAAAANRERLRQEAAGRVSAALGQLLVHPETAAARLLDGGAGDSAGRDAFHDSARQTLRDAVFARLERMEAEERERALRDDAERKRADAAREREALRRELSERESRLRRAQDAWRRWLEAKKLPADLDPDAMPELFALADQGRQLLRRRERIADRMARLEAGLAEFESAVREAEAEFRPERTGRMVDAAASVQEMYREALRHREAEREASRLDVRLADAVRAAQAAEEAALRAKADADALLAAAGCRTDDEYERRIRIDERRRQCRKERREARLRLEAGRDPDRLSWLYGTLERFDEAALAQRLEEEEQALRTLESRRAELLDRKGRLAQERERLRREAEVESRAQDLEERLGELSAAAERYAELALAAALLRRTKAVFERDKQPEVLRRASRYFEAMTAGRYRQIAVSGEKGELLAETADRRLVDSGFMSRGTREQLYLALRFALAGSVSPHQPLPLFLDDLFVHFDAERLERTLPVIGELSRERQIVVFTCHAHVAERFRTGLGDLARIIEWNAANAAR